MWLCLFLLWRKKKKNEFNCICWTAAFWLKTNLPWANMQHHVMHHHKVLFMLDLCFCFFSKYISRIRRKMKIILMHLAAKQWILRREQRQYYISSIFIYSLEVCNSLHLLHYLHRSARLFCVFSQKLSWLCWWNHKEREEEEKRRNNNNERDIII